MKKKSSVICVLTLLGGLALATPAFADLIVDYGFTTNTNIPDGTGQYTTTHTLGGLSAITDVNVSLNLNTPIAGNPMFLGDLYSTLTYGAAPEATRTAVLLNRPGRDTSNNFGSSLSSLNVLLDDTAAHPNIWGTTTGTGTYNSDGRLNVNPYGPAVAFNPGDRTNTLAALNGAALPSNDYTLLFADTSVGGIARLVSWGMTVQGAAAATTSNGTMTADAANGGTMSISDDGGTNVLGANVVTTQSGGGALSVTATGTLTFSGVVSGTGGLNKLGSGSLTLQGVNTYSGNTTVDAGTLLANNTSGSATGTGAVTVNNSGTVLGGTGRITGGVTVNANAKLQSGDGTTGTTLTLNGALTLNDNSIIQLALGPSGAHSTLARTGSGTWTFDNNQAFTFIDLGATSGNYDNIITNLAADPGTENNWIITNAGWVGTFTFDGSNIDLNLAPVPEPSTWLGAALGLSAMIFFRRRQLAELCHKVLSRGRTL